MSVPPSRAYGVSQYRQERLHPVSLTNTQGRPWRVDSPWMLANISVTFINIMGYAWLKGFRGVSKLDSRRSVVYHTFTGREKYITLPYYGQWKAGFFGDF
jgi:hypothetical protein